LTTTDGRNDLAGNYLPVLRQRVKGSRCRVQSKHDANAASEYPTHVGSNLPRDSVELAVGGLPASGQLGPQLLPPFRHFRYPLSISNRPRHSLADSMRCHRGLVGPGDPAPCGDVRETLGTGLASKSNVPKRNYQDLLQVFLEEERRFLNTESARATIGELAAPCLPAQKHCSADAVTAWFDF
jgi:hypothetical protein